MHAQFTCSLCGKTFTRNPHYQPLPNTYCSRQCAADAKKRPLSDVWKFVEVRATDECWPWTGARNENGYGIIKRQRRWYRAHRITYYLTNGEWPSRLACHTCDNPPCCNPAHVYDGTHADNRRDKLQRNPRPSGKLSATDVRAIRKRLSTGETCQSIANDYRVSRVQINNIKLRKQWKHIA